MFLLGCSFRSLTRKFSLFLSLFLPSSSPPFFFFFSSSSPLPLFFFSSASPTSSIASCDAKPRSRSTLARKGNTAFHVDLKTLVGKNLKHTILSSRVDQFVLFMNSETDKLGNRYMEELRSVARRFRVDYSVEFFDFDVDMNDVTLKSVDLEFTPALYFFGAGAKGSPILYRESEFTGEEVMNWMDKVVTMPFTGIIDGKQHGSGWPLVKYNLLKIATRGPFKWIQTYFFEEHDEIPMEELERRMIEKNGEL